MQVIGRNSNLCVPCDDDQMAEQPRGRLMVEWPRGRSKLHSTQAVQIVIKFYSEHERTERIGYIPICYVFDLHIRSQNRRFDVKVTFYSCNVTISHDQISQEVT